MIEHWFCWLAVLVKYESLASNYWYETLVGQSDTAVKIDSMLFVELRSSLLGYRGVCFVILRLNSLYTANASNTVGHLW